MVLSTKTLRGKLPTTRRHIDDAAGGMKELRLLLLGWNRKDRIISPALHR